MQKSSVEILQSKEYGASYALLHMAKELELDKVTPPVVQKRILELLGVRL